MGGKFAEKASPFQQHAACFGLMIWIVRSFDTELNCLQKNKTKNKQTDHQLSVFSKDYEHNPVNTLMAISPTFPG